VRSVVVDEPPAKPLVKRSGCAASSPAVQLSLSSSRSCSVHEDGSVCCWGRAWSSDPPACTEKLGCITRDGVRTSGADGPASGVTSHRMTPEGPRPTFAPDGAANGPEPAPELLDHDRFFTSPERLADLADVAQLAIGERHGCALHRNGRVSCWGSNRVGQLGEPERGESLRPKVVPGLEDVAQLVSGDYFSCARRKDDAVRCWGSITWRSHNAAGGFVDNGAFTAPEAWKVPRAVEDIEPADQLVAGVRTVCAWHRGSSLDCFGLTPEWIRYRSKRRKDRPYAFTPAGLVQVSLGDEDACMRFADGRLSCWGDRHCYGRPSSHDHLILEHHASSLGLEEKVGPAAAVAAGFRHHCAIRRDGAVRCWGHNERGQLGDGSTWHRSEPVAVKGLTKAREVALGRTHSCAIADSGLVLCWGSNNQGQLGDGSMRDRSTAGAVRYASAEAAPQPHDEPHGERFDLDAEPWRYTAKPAAKRCGADGGPQPPSPVRELVADHRQGCALHADGTVRCWGLAQLTGDGTSGTRYRDYDVRRTPVQALGVRDTEQLCIGGLIGCARRRDGTVHCWGFKDDNTPLPNGVTDASRIACDDHYLCVVRGGGKVECAPPLEWTERGRRRLIRRVALRRAASELWAGNKQACALLADGSVWCWQPYANKKPAEKLALTKPPKKITLGVGFGCALATDGTVACWGKGYRGQLGIGKPGESAIPVAVAGLADVTDLDSSINKTCARTADGKLWCWGDDPEHILSADPFVAKPLRIDRLPAGGAFAVGSRHGCGANAAGAVCCWGDNRWGQRGDGSDSSAAHATFVRW